MIKHNPICNKSNQTGSTRGAGTMYPSGAHEFFPVFRRVRVARSFVFCVVFCRSMFVLFSFDQCIVCNSSINRVLSLCYFQTFCWWTIYNDVIPSIGFSTDFKIAIEWIVKSLKTQNLLFLDACIPDWGEPYL